MRMQARSAVAGYYDPTLLELLLEQPTALLKSIHKKDTAYKLGVLRGITSFSGMWVYKDDHTDVRVLGSIAKALPELMKPSSVEKYINEKLKNNDYDFSLIDAIESGIVKVPRVPVADDAIRTA